MRRITMNDQFNFHQLLQQYMKKNFDELMNMSDENNSLFNMIIAHSLINWTEQSSNNHSDIDLQEIERYLDEAIEEQQKAYENMIHLLTDKSSDEQG